MLLYRPGYIVSGIIFLIAAYASYEYFKFSTTVTVIIVFISISNLYYAFTDPKEDLPKSKFPPGYLFFKASQQFFNESQIAKLEQKEIDKLVIACPNCKFKEKLFNLNNNHAAKLMIFNEDKPMIRKKDGLNIFPMICFKCKSLTEFAADPNNASGRALDGVEYFKKKKISEKNIMDALDYPKKINNELLIKKINNL